MARWRKVAEALIATVLVATLLAPSGAARHDINGPTAAWDLDEGTGPFAFDSVGSFDGILGDEPFAPEGVPGIVGPWALAFDPDDTVDAYLFYWDIYSFELWIAVPPSSAGVPRMLLGDEGCFGNSASLFLDWPTPGLWLWQGGGVLADLGPYPADGLPHHIVVTYDGTKKEMGSYLDGVGGVLPGSFEPPVRGRETTTIGAAPDDRCGFGGDGGPIIIDNVVLWHEALTPGEVETRFLATSSGTGAPYPVPELSSIMLLGTGLLAIAGVVVARRRA